MEHKNQEVLSAPMTIIAMVNGMIGGLILLLPVYALNAGYLLTLIVILFTGVFSYYSCYLCLLHLGDQPDLDYAILKHFNGQRWVKICYDLCVWFSLMCFFMLYFQLIIIQWQGLVPPHEFSPVNPIVNTFVLLALIFLLKYFEFGASIMSYGIISIISYLVFLVWVIATYNDGDGTVEYKPIGSGAVNLAAAMGAAFSIQMFFIPILKKNPKPKRYTFYTALAYTFGSFAYYYIAYIGSVGIWHRTYIEEKGGQQTIESYFAPGSWQVNIIQAIYLIHLYSVFPEFMLISKKRMFGVLNLKESEKGSIKVTEIVYFLLMIGICFVIGYFRVDIDYIIDLNGGVLGFFFIYFIPAALHVKCLYFSKGKRPIPTPQILLTEIGKNTPTPESGPRKRSQIEIIEGNFSSISENKKQQQPLLNNLQPIYMANDKKQLSEGHSTSQQNKQGQTKREEIPLKQAEKMKQRINAPSIAGAKEEQLDLIAEARSQKDYFYCNCDLKNYSTKALVLDWVFIIIMVGLGVFIMFNAVYTVATSS